MSDDINCAYSIDGGGYCTKHSNAFYDAACKLLDGKPCEDRKPVAEPCNNLSKPFKTNADCIRCWTDEEIADFTIGVADGVFKLITGEKMPDDVREEMKMRWLDWLRQEVEE